MNKPESSVDELHAQIMNLPDGVIPAPVDSDFVAGFRRGHKAARHAAAELVAALPSNQVLQEPVAITAAEVQEFLRDPCAAVGDYWQRVADRFNERLYASPQAVPSEQPIAEQPTANKANDLVAVGSDLPGQWQKRHRSTWSGWDEWQNCTRDNAVMLRGLQSWETRFLRVETPGASAGAQPSDKKYLPAASLPVSAPAGVRMLTREETYCAWDSAGCPLGLDQFRALVDAAIHDFCAVNGLKLAAMSATTKEPQ